jgi:hypothetical protein
MEAIILTSEQYKEMLEKMNQILEMVQNPDTNPKAAFVDNADFIQLMNISKRTAQTWRDEGIISFSQIGSKIYYRMEDVKELLDKNYNKGFKK